MCSTDVYCSKQTGSSSTKGTITHHFFVSELGRRKLSMQLKFVAAEMLLNRNPANIRKWIARFITLWHHTRRKRVYVHTIAWVAHRYGQLYLHCSLIYFWVFPSCFCIVTVLSEGEITRSAVFTKAGEAALSTPEACAHALTTDCFDAATDDDQRQHHHAEHHFQL